LALLTLQGFKIAFTAIITTLLALYAPLLSLNAYSATLSEVVYEGSNYKVTYKSPLIPLAPGNKTSVVLEVKRNGKPIDFGFTLSGITIDGAKDVARGRGYGRAKADIAGYVDDVVRVLREANSNPAHSGLGLLTFIISKIEEDGEEYIATDIISIPVIPGKARGKNIVVEVEFKPVHKIKLNKTSGGEQTGKAEVLQTTPPPILIDLCYGPDHSYICYYWELDRVLLRSHLGGAPVIIAYLDSIDGDYIRRVDLTNDITLTRSEHRWISFELALTFLRTVKFIAPGPGYYREISSGLNSEKLFSLACTFYNSKLSNELSDCNYMGDQGFTPYPRNFYGEALLAIGFRGYMWLVEYKYIERRYDGEKVIDRSLAVYLVPLFNSRGKIEYWYDVDDNPYDGRGMLEKVFWNITTNQYVKSVRFPSFTGTSWRVISYDVKVSSNSPAAFGIAIPVGALAVLARGGVLPSPWSAVVSAVFALTVGVAVSVAGESEFYMNFATAYFLATQSVTFAPRYYHVDKSYMVKEAGGEYRVPFMIVQPFVY
jgi:hypothetical protein